MQLPSSIAETHRVEIEDVFVVPTSSQIKEWNCEFENTKKSILIIWKNLLFSTDPLCYTLPWIKVIGHFFDLVQSSIKLIHIIPSLESSLELDKIILDLQNLYLLLDSVRGFTDVYSIREIVKNHLNQLGVLIDQYYPQDRRGVGSVEGFGEAARRSSVLLQLSRESSENLQLPEPPVLTYLPSNLRNKVLPWLVMFDTKRAQREYTQQQLQALTIRLLTYHEKRTGTKPFKKMNEKSNHPIHKLIQANLHFCIYPGIIEEMVFVKGNAITRQIARNLLGILSENNSMSKKGDRNNRRISKIDWMDHFRRYYLSEVEERLREEYTESSEPKRRQEGEESQLLSIILENPIETFSKDRLMDHKLRRPIFESVSLADINTIKEYITKELNALKIEDMRTTYELVIKIEGELNREDSQESRIPDYVKSQCKLTKNLLRDISEMTNWNKERLKETKRLLERRLQYDDPISKAKEMTTESLVESISSLLIDVVGKHCLALELGLDGMRERQQFIKMIDNQEDTALDEVLNKEIKFKEQIHRHNYPYPSTPTSSEQDLSPAQNSTPKSPPKSFMKDSQQSFMKDSQQSVNKASQQSFNKGSVSESPSKYSKEAYSPEMRSPSFATPSTSSDDESYIDTSQSDSSSVFEPFDVTDIKKERIDKHVESSEKKVGEKVVGVCFQRQQKTWVATYCHEGKKIHHYFSVSKYGYDEAFKLAVQWRHDHCQPRFFKGISFNKISKCWNASVHVKGKRRNASFPIKVHGSKAEEKALQWRLEMMERKRLGLLD